MEGILFDTSASGTYTCHDVAAALAVAFNVSTVECSSNTNYLEANILCTRKMVLDIYFRLPTNAEETPSYPDENES